MSRAVLFIPVFFDGVIDTTDEDMALKQCVVSLAILKM